MTDQPDLGQPTAEAAAAALAARNVETVHVGIFDTNAALRERRMTTRHAIAAMKGTYSFPNVVHRWDVAETVFDGAATFVSEAAAIEPASGRAYPFEPNSALYVADFTGPSAPRSPRLLLKRQIAKADAMGFGVRAAFECEFTVLAETAESLRAGHFGPMRAFAPDNHCYAADSGAAFADLLSGLEAVLARLGVPMYSLGTELGPGCVEATLEAREPLAAADDYALFRSFTKAFCRTRGLTAAFMAQLGAGFQGLSGHLNLSLVDKKSGRPAFPDGAARDGTSATMRHFIGGLLRVLPEATALCTHTANAYRRMVPGNWSPRSPTWGFGNYSVAVRAVAGDPATTRIEFRVPAADTNPHLTLAMALGAGLWGIETKAEPPAPAEGDARDVVPEGFQPLPRNLTEAADRLDRSKLSRGLYGDAFIDPFVASRRHEDAAVQRWVSAEERARYLEAI
jgi:glutamine synthetase